MNVKEAQQFVADYSRGDYDPVEHAAFVRWLRGASEGDMHVIADAYESHREQWVLSADEPSSEWVKGLEHKLDRLDRLAEKRQAPVVSMPYGKKVWFAAASIALLIIAGAVWYSRSGGSLNKEERRQALATLTQTVTVAPAGELRSVVLPDGSKVWLNVASSLKYPVRFNGPERVVELSGEADFNVTENSNMPFRVLFKDAEVRVLGTHFDIMAYDDEPVARTTLIDGSVRIESGSQGVTLHPGEQGEILYSSTGPARPLKIVPGINPNAVLAWRNGVLSFEKTDLRAVMRTLARSYNVDIHVDQSVPVTTISGNFLRSEGLNQILKQLEREHLYTKTDGTTVTVSFAK